MSALEIHLIPCLTDNYAYLLVDARTNCAAVVDPSEAAPVKAVIDQRRVTLTHILNTHHHFDHTGGNLDLKAATGASIVGPASDRARIPGIDLALGEDSDFSFAGHRAQILDIPGHTSGHIAFWFKDSRAVFTGDTLFSLGCGRLFEGTPAQMWQSLSKLAQLPPETRIYCGHEYTESNARFALTIDPHNAELHQRAEDVRHLRARRLPTIPSTIGLERHTNPFLRAGDPALQRALGMAGEHPVTVFAEIRRRKDNF
ncbi:MAG: hydroxyacylglutathione hydrolase [Alphaproteobacteria bacterium]|nr:hydroxyacylglutathione hydrolase [Alphaproteobacteria bacterium]